MAQVVVETYHEAMYSAAKPFFLWLSLFSAFAGQASTAEESTIDVATRFFKPLPAVMPNAANDTALQVALGKELYFETRLSANNSQSCNSCHPLDNDGAGMDGLRTSAGALGAQGTRNSPTTWNAGLQNAQFWDGRADTLEEQAASPLLNPSEMALDSKATAIGKLRQASYEARFRAAFPAPEIHSAPAINNSGHRKSSTPKANEQLSFTNLVRALSAFQRTLITRDRFDAYLLGDEDALTETEKRGMVRFIQTGCNACHNGPLLGGDSIMKLGVVHPYPNDADTGRAEVTGKRGDRFFFKVPPLRNVGLTAPYFHDGAVKELEAAVAGTAWHQLGVRLSEEDTADITAFLRSMDNLQPLGASVSANADANAPEYPEFRE